MNIDKSYVPSSAMAIVAHPDDIEFSCAGTLALWARAGTRISYVLCTSGDVGIALPDMSRDLAIEIRESEQREAADIVGATEVIFLREPDGMLQPTLDLRRKLVREIRRFRPEVVICGDPTLVWVGENYINHPDHRASAQASLDAVFPASGQPNLFEELAQEGIIAFKPRKVFVSMRKDENSDNLLIDIDDTIDDKIRALHAHKSQFERFDPEKSVRERSQDLAKDGTMTYAELFYVVTLETDEEWEAYHGEVFDRSVLDSSS